MRNERISFSKNMILMCVGLGAILVLTGCVERKLTINTEPAGALVRLNDEEIGVSPVTVEFNWYGDYKVRISKEGYATLDTHRELKGPVHDAVGLDFFAEILWPGRIVDEYEWSFELEPYQPPARAELIEAAGRFRERTGAALAQGQRQWDQEQKAQAGEGE
ncbi:MAG: PEGA domain-containing protein [Planctomycetota bacterium]|jgi:hypothetical protein